MPDRGLVGAEPCALTIAGLDPSGGAGIAADLRAFHAAGVWGCAVCSLLTVQSTAGLRSVVPQSAELISEQVEEVLRNERVMSIKTGALGSAENVRAVTALLKKYSNIPAVVDPVMIATRVQGQARLLDESALTAMRELIKVALVVTPNVDEAGALLGTKIRTIEELREAGIALVGLGARAVLVKGGHLTGEYSVDVLATKESVVLLRTVRRKGPEFHGGGCTLASLVAGHIAQRLGQGVMLDDDLLTESVRWAKRKITSAIAHATKIGKGLLVLRPLQSWIDYFL